MNERTRHGFTIAELAALIAAAAFVLGLTVPAASTASCDAMRQRSIHNLIRLGSAHAAYAADWNDRQFTLVRDDLAAYGSDASAACRSYRQKAGCHPPVILGEDCGGVTQGFFMCGDGAGSCANIVTAIPFTFSGSSTGLGSFRIPNARGFHEYAAGRFFDPTFYAPKDAAVLAIVEPLFGERCEYVSIGDPNLYKSSSYALSPAAMFDPEVMRHDDPEDPTANGWTSPFALDDGLRSPAVSQALYPDLKTRMLEHHWLQGNLEACNPGFEPGSFNGCEPYYFNLAKRSNPMTLFFDGHVRGLSTLEAIIADARVRQQTGWPDWGLWSRDTPLGPNGYFGAYSFDNLQTSYHVLTTDGIRGRDTVNQQAADAQAAR